MKGRITDVAKEESFGKYVYAELSEDNQYTLWIPPGFAQGIQALDYCVIFRNEYSPPHERCLDYTWPIKSVMKKMQTIRKKQKYLRIGNIKLWLHIHQLGHVRDMCLTLM